MLNINYLKIVPIIFILTSCYQIDNNKNQEIISDNFSIVVPSNLERTQRLNTLSKVQFENIEEDIYFIVLEESKRGFKDAIEHKMHKATPDLNGYLEVVVNHFREISTKFALSDVGRTKIDQCNAYIFSMTSEEPSDNLVTFYRYAIIEDNENYYQIMSWTHLKNKKNLIGIIDEVIHSFKIK